MNYEEMLNAREGVAVNKDEMPLGTFYKKLIDRKYRNVVELKHSLADSLRFCDGLRQDRQTALTIKDAHQMHYELHEDSGGVYEIELQPGNYQTMAQLLENTPAIVAQKGFMDKTVNALMDITMKLHEKGVYHLCYAPQTLFMRKSDNSPMLLCHGSSFVGAVDQNALYEGFADYVAPEVLGGEKPDERSDVYALGRIIERLGNSGNMAYEYKAVVKKATNEDPAKRYATVSDMKSAIGAKRNSRRSLIMLIAACVLVGVLVWAYFDLMPQSSNVEFVDGTGAKQKDYYEEAERSSVGLAPSDDPYAEDNMNGYEEYMDPDMEQFMDSMGPMSYDEAKQLADSATATQQLEVIFQRRFTKHANEKLSKLYSSEQMGSGETEFLSNSNSVTNELYEYAKQLSKDTGIPLDRANTMAAQIISRVQSQLQENVIRYGSMTKSE